MDEPRGYRAPSAGLARFRAIALLAGMLACCCSPALAERYKLQPGDSLRLIIAGLPGGDWTATIGTGGDLTFPHLGSLPATGQTLPALRRALTARLRETVAVIVSADGRLLEIPLAGIGAHLDVVAFRPIFVTGDVRQSGEVMFTPGLTVRSALARFGGLAPPIPDSASLDVQRWQSLHAQAALEEAASTAALWRIMAALDRDAAAPGPTIGPGVPKAVFDALVEAERRHVRQALAEIDARTAALERMIALSIDRARTLARKRDTYAEAVAQEEADLALMQGLFERGGLGLQRIAEMRRVLLASTTRLLEVEDGLAAEDMRRLRLVEDRRSIETDFNAALLSQRAALLQAKADAATRRHLAMDKLAEAGIDPLPGFAEPDLLTTIHAYRQIDGEIRRILLKPDDPVAPGDILEVRQTSQGF